MEEQAGGVEEGAREVDSQLRLGWPLLYSATRN